MSSTRDPQLWARACARFDEAVALAGEQRDAWLRRLEREEPAVAVEVAELLAADGGAPGILEAPLDLYAGDLLDDEPGEAEEPAAAEEGWSGRRIGRWQVVREIGRGGMGAVLLAERADGEFRQRVALKLLKRGMDSEEILARFRRERQILAGLEHPQIAHLIDGGLSDEGQPYFAMEYVEGEPIDAYCSRHGLDVAARLRLLIGVAAAVQHAHRHLVVHRDLKPSNILVTAEGGVKLLDFGIAKLLAADGEEAPLTRATRVLTPEYASPEQLEGAAETTATDVYALGLLLYELLAGRRPTRGEVGAAVAPVLPPLSSAAPPALRRQLRGDLDRIVATALAVEPERRYASAEALAEDLRRHLEGRPISARGGDWVERSVKFVRRHRVGVAAVAATGAALAVGLGVALWQGRQTAREARKLAAVKDFLIGVFALADPDEARGRTVTARELLDRGAARLDRELTADRAVHAELDATVAAIYASLGLYEPAEHHARRALELRREALGGAAAETLESQATLAEILTVQGDAAAGEELVRDALAALGERTDVELRALLLGELASARNRRGDFAAAVRLSREALALREKKYGPESEEVSAELNDLAVLLYEQGQLEEAEALHRRGLELRLRRHGGDHPEVATALYNLACVLSERELKEEARSLCARAVEMRRRVLGPDHPHLGLALLLEGELLQDLGRYDDAEAHFREALAVQRRAHGERSHEVANIWNSLAVLAYLRGDLAGAAEALRSTLDVFEALYGHEHPDVASVRLNLGAALRDLGEFAAAEPLLRDGLEVRLRLLAPDHPGVATAMNYLGVLLRRTGRLAEAESLQRRALEVRLAQFEPGSEPVVRSRHAVGRVFHERGDLAGAEPLYVDALTGARSLFPDGHDLIAEVETSLGLLRLDQGREEEAQSLLEHAWTWCRGAHGGADWRNGETAVAYGLTLGARGRRGEAEPLLRAGLDALAPLRRVDDPLVRRGREALARPSRARGVPQSS